MAETATYMDIHGSRHKGVTYVTNGQQLLSLDQPVNEGKCTEYSHNLWPVLTLIDLNRYA
jgi:hypothetical protein